jgi:hypothetical protein
MKKFLNMLDKNKKLLSEALFYIAILNINISINI